MFRLPGLVFLDNLNGVGHHFVKGFFVAHQCPFIAHLFDLVGNKKTLPTLQLTFLDK